MKVTTVLCFSLLISHTLVAQSSATRSKTHQFKKYDDSATDTSLNYMSTYATPGSKKYFSKGNIVFVTTNLQLTPIEMEISDLEAAECNALLKRDTSALTKIWARDFTLDARQNEVTPGKNPLPYYVSLSRMVENFTEIENAIYTRGYEMVILLKTDATMSEPVKRQYFHVWMKRIGGWKLVTKTLDEEEGFK